MQRNHTKSVRKQLRDLVALAHERELARNLDAIATQFDQWRAGVVSPWDLNDAIHQYHQGASRDVWGRYNVGSLYHEVLVARALASGVLNREEIPTDVLAVVEKKAANLSDIVSE